MDDRCSVVSADLEEPLAGSAAVVPAWLLVEDVGPWGPDGLTASTIDPGVAATLESRAKEAGVRVQLIRRHERVRTSATHRVVYWVHSGPGQPWARRAEVAEDDLAELDPSIAMRPESPSDVGEAVEDDILLVCTHAKRDACCAQLGRPLAASLANKVPEQTWETSHTGGHRFAGIVIALPDGHTFGRLVPRDIRTLVNALQSGRVPLGNYRGRSAVTGPAQAAEVAVRQTSGIDGRRAVRAVGMSEQAGATVVQVDADGDRWRVIVASRPFGTLRIISCGGSREDRQIHEVVGVAPVGPPVTIGSD